MVCQCLFGNFYLLLWLYFVATKVFLGFSKDNVLSKLLAVLAQRELFGRVLSVLGCVIYALTRLFTHEPDKFTLLAFFCHIPSILTDSFEIVKQKYRLIIPVFLLPAEIMRSFANLFHLFFRWFVCFFA